jgi:hypothetical protein
MSRNKKCEKCGAEIYFLKTKKGGFMPVDVAGKTMELEDIVDE